MKSDETIEQLREQAALYALGALPPEEAQAVEAQLAAGDARYQAEVAAFRAVADALAYCAPPAAPRSAARARTLEAVAAHEAATIDEGGLRFVRSGQVDWMPGPVKGLELKLLRLDEAEQRATLLARMAPGTTYPSHRHGGLEELYLLEGDLLVGDVLMRPGDYCSAEPATIHTGIRTIRGCLFVTTQSTCDEILA